MKDLIHGYRFSAVSIALCREKTPVTALVWQPYTGEMFYAEKGRGAFLNDRPIHTSETPFSEALVAFGTAPYYEELTDRTFDWAKYFFKRSLDIRRGGSAAIDLCNVAVGRAELFFELRLQPWDFAAGALIVKEAGGCVRTTEGEGLRFDRACGVIATNYVCRDEKHPD